MKEHDILCPYCPDGIEMQMAMSGTHMRCPKCGSTSPVINDLHTACFTPEEIVRTVARRRYVRRSVWQYAVDFEDESARNDYDVTCAECGLLFGDVEDRTAAKMIFDLPYCHECGSQMGGALNADND